jgi:general stress protein 26
VDRETMLSILKANSLHTYLATCDGDQPRVRPMATIIEDDPTIWIVTYACSNKVRQIRQNPKICLAFVDHPRGDREAILVGRAKIEEDLEQKKRVWKLATFDLAQHFPQGPESADFCVLRIVPTRIDWRDSVAGKSGTYEPAP